IGNAADGGLGQAGQARQVLIAQRHGAGAEAAQHVQPAGQRHDELGHVAALAGAAAAPRRATAAGLGARRGSIRRDLHLGAFVLIVYFVAQNQIPFYEILRPHTTTFHQQSGENMFKRISLFAAAAALSASAGLAHAAYPERPITIVSPFPAGGATDTLTRVLAERMAKALDQSIIVENKAGAGTTIGAAYVARAQPDGYTLLM